jgi:hypothetical protein
MAYAEESRLATIGETDHERTKSKIGGMLLPVGPFPNVVKEVGYKLLIILHFRISLLSRFNL